MTDHKFTDDDVIKALECCRDFGDCSLCPYEEATFNDELDCTERMHTDALALINRQKAEIESLNAVHADAIESLRLAAEANKDMSVELDAMRGAANSYKMHYEEAERKYQIAVAEREANVEGFIETLKTIKAEAIKEFAERVKANMSNIARMEYGGNIYFCVGYDLIDTLVKEMTEETK